MVSRNLFFIGFLFVSSVQIMCGGEIVLESSKIGFSVSVDKDIFADYWQTFCNAFNLVNDNNILPDTVNVNVSENILCDIKTFVEFKEL